MSSITNYGTLKTAIADWLGRSDLTTQIADFVSFATDLFNYGAGEDDPASPIRAPALRCREMEIVDDLTPTSGVCTLPDDYLQWRGVVEKASVRRNLTYITPDAAELLYADRASGLANQFTIKASSLYTFPLASNDIELTYYGSLTALSGDSDTNWLLTKNPQAYLRAALLGAYDYTRDDDGLAKTGAMHRTFVTAMNRNSMLAQYARAGLTMAGVTP